MLRACQVCAGPLRTSNPRAKYCGDRCSKRAQRGRQPVAFTRDQALEEVRACLELLPQDLAVLEDRHPTGADDEVDEVIGGLWTHLAGLERLEFWLIGGAS